MLQLLVPVLFFSKKHILHTTPHAYLEAQVPANLGTNNRKLISDALNILITTTRQADNNVLILLHGLGQFKSAPDTVRRLQRRDDTLQLTHQAETLKGLSVRGSHELGTLGILPVGQLGADTGVIETGGDGVGVLDLTELVLQDVGADTVQNTLTTGGKGGTVAGSVDTVTTGLNTEHLDAGVVGEGVEHADGIGTTANAGDDGVGELAALLQHLLLGLVADDGLEGAHNGGEGVRTNGGADDVVGVGKVDDPVAESLVDGVAEGAAAGLDGDDLGAEKLHAEDVESLATDILGTHEDGAFHAELGADGSGGNTVLTGTGLGDNLLLAESASEEELAESVVDLVRTGVIEILTLQPDVGTTGVLGETLGLVKLTGTAHPGVVRAVLFPESGIILDLVETLLKLGQAIHERLRDVLTTELTETLGNGAVESGKLGVDVGLGNDAVDGGGTDGLLGGLEGIAHVELVGGLVKVAAAEVRAVLLNSLGLLTLGSLLESGDDHATNDNTVGNSANGGEVLMGANTETNGSGLVAAVLLDAAEELGKVGVESAGSAGDTLAGNNVDEGVGELAENAHTGVRGGGRNKRDVRETAAAAELAEGDGLLRRQVNNDEAIDTGLLAVVEEALLAVAEQRVVVAHEKDGSLEAALTGVAHHLQGRVDGDAMLESNL